MIKSHTFFFICCAFIMLRAEAQKQFAQTGLATYYSDVFQGRYTASGVRYDNKLMTAAHATLPFHTFVKVTNLKNNLFVVVEINDRCPKYTNRVIDLSKEAAKKIDIISSGIAQVKVEVIDTTGTGKANLSIDSLLIKLKADTAQRR